MIFRKTAGILLGIVHTLLLCQPVLAQQTSFPSKAIQFIVPFPAGGASDILSRQLALSLQGTLGQPVLVDNRGGAGTIIGTDLAAKSKPDGHTVFLLTTPFAVNDYLFESLPYNSRRDLLPVVDIASVPLVLVVPPNSAISTVDDLIRTARREGGKLTYASSGVGNATHLAMELLANRAGVKLTHVPYKGSAPALNDLLAGHVDAIFETMPLVAQYVNSGKVKAVAQTGTSRHLLLPNVPLMEEQGFKNFDTSSPFTWFMLAVPSGTPKAIVEKINVATNSYLSSSTAKKLLTEQGFTVTGGTPEAAAKHVYEAMDQWRTVIIKSEIERIRLK